MSRTTSGKAGVPSFPDRDRVLGAFFEGAPDLITILDRDGVILDVNAAWERAAAEGWGAWGTRRGAVYVDVAEWSRPEDGILVTAGVRAVLSGEASYFDHEYALSRPDSPPRWFTVRIYPITLEEPLRFAAVHADTTEARSARRHLSEARRQQWVMLEQASDAATLLNPEGVILKANARAGEVFGYSPAEMEGLHIRTLVTPRDLPRQAADLSRLIREGEARTERTVLRADGSLLRIEISSRVLEDGRVLALIRDVSERTRRAGELERQAAMLAERVKEQRCLYAVSRALAEGDGLEATLAAVVRALPGGWQFPEQASARITLDGIEAATPDFERTERRQRAPLQIDGEVRGWIEVAYREAPADPGRAGPVLGPDEAEPGEAGWFLPEERALIDEVAARVTDAVRRHRAEERLRRSEAYFRALTEKGSDLVSITTADGTVVYQSPPLIQALGMKPEERVGKSIFDRIHADDAPRVQSEFTRALLDASYQPTIEFRVAHTDGSWRVLESTGRNLLADPAVNGFVVESRDVTARWEARERIRFQAQILDLVGQAVVATDTAGRVTYWNRAAEDLYGWEQAEVLGRGIREIIPLDPTQPAVAGLLAAVGRGERWVGEVTAARRDGTRFPVLVADTPILDAHETLAGYVAVATDMTDRKAAEMALRASEEWSRALIENASDLTVVLDAAGRIVYTSPNRARILGASAESVVGKDASSLLDVHPEDYGDAMLLWTEVFSDQGAKCTHRMTVRVQHANGSWRTLECIAQNLLEDPAVRGVVINARDITDRAHLEMQLQQAQKMEAIGRLAGGVAHDFNNLLTGIQGYAQLSIEELPDDHEVRPGLEEISRAAQRAAGLTRQLLAFSRRQIMQPRVVDPNRTVEELRRMLTRLIGEDVALLTELDEAAGCILVDPGQLEQVILNLAVNARDAMPRGGRLTLRTGRALVQGGDAGDGSSGLAPGEYFQLDVRDTGEGMSAEVMEHLFEPFFTTKELGKGTGLGLSTVYGIVMQSGGHIKVESEPGRGTTFRVYFPATDAVPEGTEPRGEAEGVAGGETVLLVEDDGAVRALASRVLRRRGYRVIEAENGARALATFRGDPAAIDIVLSDVVMPELGGRELAERVLAERPGIPVLLMSGYTDDVIVRHGAHGIGAGFLEKPFTPNGLAERVREVLEARPDGAAASRSSPPRPARPARP